MLEQIPGPLFSLFKWLLICEAINLVWATVTWIQTFGGGKRVPRTDQRSPSHEPLTASPLADFNQLQEVDHIYLPLLWYLWAFCCIFHGAAINQITGISWTYYRTILENNQQKVPYPHGPSPGSEKLVAGLILETSLVLEVGPIFLNPEHHHCASASFPNFGYLTNKGVYEEAGDLEIVLDLDQRAMLKATLANKPIPADDVLVHLTLHYELVYHANTHAFSNWGVNLESSHPYIRSLSAMTIAYNYFGGTYFPSFALLLGKLGVVYPCQELHRYLGAQRQHKVTDHTRIYQLQPYSRMVSFLVQLRVQFLRTFRKYRQDFDGIDSEAFFVGSIIHGLDHTMYEKVIPDPMWIVSSNEDLKASVLLSRIILSGFNADLPLLPFNRKYSNAGHPFFQEVYQFAKQYDAELAEHLDTCVCK